VKGGPHTGVIKGTKFCNPYYPRNYRHRYSLLGMLAQPAAGGCLQTSSKN